MKNKLIYFLFIVSALTVNNAAFSQVYEKDAAGDYVIATSSDVMKYNPPQPDAIRGGLFRDTSLAERLSNVALFITDNKTETSVYTKRLNPGGMKLNFFYPKVLAGKNAANQELPVIIFGYGGGFLNAYSLLNLGGGPADGHIERWLAKKGYIVIAPEYRIGIDLFDEELAKRAVWRAVQDIRKVVQKCKSFRTTTYCVDASKPITYVGYSSGGFIGLHNLYFNDGANRPQSTKAGFPTLVGPFNSYKTTAVTQDLGTLNDPVGGYESGIPNQESGMSEQYVPDITVSLSGALGDVSWITTNLNVKPKALYLIHHPLDGVVPFTNGSAYEGFGLFASDNFNYPQVSGSHSINYVFDNELVPYIIQPDYYKYSVIDADCSAYPAGTCIQGNAGGEVGPLSKIKWYHNPTDDATNENVMKSILKFIQDSTYNLLNPNSPIVISKQSVINEKTNVNNIAITLYPNPLKGDILNITAVPENTTYKITNTLGQVLSKGAIDNGTIKINTLSTGTYFIELVTNEQRIVKQIIKQ